jgi:hypothetical protein
VSTPNRSDVPGGRLRYRITLEGMLGEGLEDWVDLSSIHLEEGVTVVEVTPADHSQLHGILRRLHDLHLRLITLTRIAPTGEGP